jgi:phosphatidylserine/phosphatidylglycerophosphate/cardiolipin synthase-like enzyme
MEDTVERATQPGSLTVPSAGTLELAFSPNEDGESFVIKVIDSARSELRVMAYSLPSASVTQALLGAKKRRVNLTLVVDQKNNNRNSTTAANMSSADFNARHWNGRASRSQYGIALYWAALRRQKCMTDSSSPI